jgi:Rad3-related DNA helicase
LEALKTVIQQTGRSTRGPEDWSNIVIMDPSFARLILKQRKFLPNGFEDAIIWGSATTTHKEN